MAYCMDKYNAKIKNEYWLNGIENGGVICLKDIKYISMADGILV